VENPVLPRHRVAPCAVREDAQVALAAIGMPPATAEALSLT